MPGERSTDRRRPPIGCTTDPRGFRRRGRTDAERGFDSPDSGRLARFGDRIGRLRGQKCLRGGFLVRRKFGSKPISPSHEGSFPSGQRGLTVNQVALPSQVRILHSPLPTPCPDAHSTRHPTHRSEASDPAIPPAPHPHKRRTEARASTGLHQPDRLGPIIKPAPIPRGCSSMVEQ